MFQGHFQPNEELSKSAMFMTSSIIFRVSDDCTNTRSGSEKHGGRIVVMWECL